MHAVVQLVLPGVVQVHEPLVQVKPVRHAVWFCQVPVASQSCGTPVLLQPVALGLHSVQPPEETTQPFGHVLALGRVHAPALQVPAPW